MGRLDERAYRLAVLDLALIKAGIWKPVEAAKALGD